MTLDTLRMWIAVAAVSALIAVTFVDCSPAEAQPAGPEVPEYLPVTPDGFHNHGHSELHYFYKKLAKPDIQNSLPGSCCNEKVTHKDGTTSGDCRPVQAWYDDDKGTWVARIDGTVVEIPKQKIIESTVAPDGNSHACADDAWTIHCFVRGMPKI